MAYEIKSENKHSHNFVNADMAELEVRVMSHMETQKNKIIKEYKAEQLGYLEAIEDLERIGYPLKEAERLVCEALEETNNDNN